MYWRSGRDYRLLTRKSLILLEVFKSAVLQNTTVTRVASQRTSPKSPKRVDYFSSLLVPLLIYPVCCNLLAYLLQESARQIHHIDPATKYLLHCRQQVVMMGQKYNLGLSGQLTQSFQARE